MLVLIPILTFAQNQKKIELPGQVIIEDASGNVIETRNVDKEGNPMEDEQGISLITCKFDKRGNKVEESFFDLHGNLTVDSLGVATRKFKYDKHANKIYQGHFGPDGELLTPNQKILYPEWFWKYDKEGNLVSKGRKRPKKTTRNNGY